MTTENKVEPVVKTMKENYDALKATVEALTLDYEKFNDKKVKAAGARVRNNLLNCKKLCDTLRKQVLADIKALPIKHRVKAGEAEDYENPPPSPKSEEDEDELIDIPDPPELVRETTTAIDAVKILEKVKKPRKQRKANKKKSVKKD